MRSMRKKEKEERVLLREERQLLKEKRQNEEELFSEWFLPL